jgi:hypothetical protein
MESGRFDALTRAISSEARTRRGVVLLLAGIAVSSVATRLGLAEAAGTKRSSAKKPKHKPRAARKAQDHLQSERKKKKKHNKPPKPPSGVCDNGHPRCPDGSCAHPGECCPGSRRCEDGFCLRETKCCDEEKICDDGSCASQDVCCPGERLCDDGGCVKPGNCCAGEQKCADGTCIPKDACCYDTPPPPCGVCERSHCVLGQEVCDARPTGDFCIRFDGLPGTCCKRECTRTPIMCANYPWRRWNPDTCTCECRAGGHSNNDANSTCCPASAPNPDAYGTCYADPVGGRECLIGYSPCACPPSQSDRSLCCCPDGA